MLSHKTQTHTPHVLYHLRCQNAMGWGHPAQNSDMLPASLPQTTMGLQEDTTRSAMPPGGMSTDVQGIPGGGVGPKIEGEFKVLKRLVYFSQPEYHMGIQEAPETTVMPGVSST